MDESASHAGRPPHPLARAAIAAAVVALVRTALAAHRDGYLEAPPWEASDLALAGLAAGWIESFLPALVVALLLVWAHVRLGRAHAPLVWAAAGYLGFQFARHGLPAERFYAPGFASPMGLAANGLALGAGAAAAWIVSPRTPVPLPRTALAATGALFLAGFAAHAASVSPEPAAWPARPNVILISLDTLRADRLGCYGYEEDTTPELDRFAARAVRFTDALTPQPWTLTAHMSLLTGRHPRVHRVEEERALPGSIPLLAERLSAAGYATIGVVDLCPWMKPEYGFARGFDVYQRVHDDADDKIDRVLAYLDDAGDRPLFLFAHFFDAHSDRRQLPYEASPEDRERFAGWYEGDFGGCEEGLGCASLYLSEANERGTPLDPERLRYLSSLYDAGVRSLDRKLGRLFAELERRGLLDTSIVVVSADHGEEFQEHGMLLHEQLVGPCVRVPLLIRTPDVAEARTWDGLVSLMDVAPTVLELAGVEEPRAPGAVGRSLAAILRGDPGGPTAQRALLLDDGSGGLVLRTRTRAVRGAGDGGFVVRDLARPDAALVPVREGTPDAALRDALLAEAARLDALGAEHAETLPPVEIPTDDVHGLRALGYTAGSDEPDE